MRGINRRCPQCGSFYCGPLVCRFYGKNRPLNHEINVTLIYYGLAILALAQEE